MSTQFDAMNNLINEMIGLKREIDADVGGEVIASAATTPPLRLIDGKLILISPNGTKYYVGVTNAGDAMTFAAVAAP